jgi:SAM-dependent methyltransferase
MGRSRKLVILAGAAAGAVAVLRQGRHAAQGHTVPGGILVGHAGVYDALSRLLLGPFAERIAADIAAVAPDSAQVLEVGCGPGHLSIRLARHGFAVTGLDLDPAMIARAQTNADRPGNSDQRRPSFLVGDVAALAFPDRSFDLVVRALLRSRDLRHVGGSTCPDDQIAKASPANATTSRRVAGSSTASS